MRELPMRDRTMRDRSMRDLKAVLALFFAERGAMLIGGALLSAFTVLAGIALLGVSGWFIAATALAGLSAAAAVSFDVFSPSALIRFLALARTGGRYGERLATHEATLGVLAGLRERLFRGWAAPGAARALLARPARLLFRLTEDIDALGQLYLRVLVPAGAALAAALAGGIALGFLVTPLAGVAFTGGLLALGMGLPLLAARRAYPVTRRRAHTMEALRARTIDLVAGQTELAMAGRLEAQRSSILAADQKMAAADDQLNSIETGLGLGLNITGAGLLAGALLLAGGLSHAGLITPPVAAALVLVALAAMEPFAALRRGALELGRTRLAARRLAPRLAPTAAPIVPEAPAADLAVHVAGVNLRHAGAERDILHDICLSVAPGERVALVGASGAGKSSLLALVSGEMRPDAGRVEAVAATTLTQRTELFQDSVRDNLRLAAPQADDATLWAVLAAVELERDIRALPEGLGARLGEGGLGLSGGQARRLALARLLLRDTPLWLLDEPTEGLDGQTAAGVLSRLLDLAHGRTVLIATHIRREAELADRIFVLARGRIIARPRRGEPGFDAALAALRPD